MKGRASICPSLSFAKTSQKKKKVKGDGDFSHRCAQNPNIPSTVWRVG